MLEPMIAMIGGGNMGSSLIGGLIASGHPNSRLIIADINQDKLSYIKEVFNIETTTNSLNAIDKADIVIIAVKPNHFKSLAEEMADRIQLRKPLIISIAAGIRIANIEEWLGGNLAIVRVMPNTPALIGAGASALMANASVTPEQHNIAESILRAVGITVWVTQESMMDTVTALSGSGPAYFFLIMEALEAAAQKLGLTPDVAKLLTLQTALGASRMAIESGQSTSLLRRQVTSPGGTTEQAIRVLEAEHLPAILEKALQAAKLRSEELAELMGKR